VQSSLQASPHLRRHQGRPSVPSPAAAPASVAGRATQLLLVGICVTVAWLCGRAGLSSELGSILAG
ncbi:hypothetical protein HaLaN_19130, partial [Haematococcus lacustris]